MKKIRKNIKMIIGIILGVIISGVTSYAVAAILINSKDVVYQDNMSIGATNVQNAIDGTCSKIDTRLSAIEDNLYTIKKLEILNNFTSSTSWFYTGISVVLPANSYCSITGSVIYGHSMPKAVSLTRSATSSNDNLAVMDGSYGTNAGVLSVTYSGYITNQMTIYLWGMYDMASTNRGSISGFCATKV